MAHQALVDGKNPPDLYLIQGPAVLTYNTGKGVDPAFTHLHEAVQGFIFSFFAQKHGTNPAIRNNMLPKPHELRICMALTASNRVLCGIVRIEWRKTQLMLTLEFCYILIPEHSPPTILQVIKVWHPGVTGDISPR